MPASKFDSIYRDLKEKIENGDYPAGSSLPSEYTLIDIYHCSRNTVRRALAMLSEQGHIQAIHGKGVQVIYRPVNQAMFTVGGIESFAESAARNHLHAHTEVLQFAEIDVDERMARQTDFEIGTPVIYIQRARYLDDKPVILDINIFMKSVVKGLTPEIASKSIYQYLEGELGVQIVTSNRRITAERATQIDEKALSLGDLDFVAVVTGQTYNSDGIMFEWTQSRHRPDYFCFYDSAVRCKL